MKTARILILLAIAALTLFAATRGLAQILPTGEVSPDPYTYPNTLQGSTSTQQFRLTNTSSRSFLDLYVFSVSVPDRTNFVIVNDACTGKTLKYNQYCTLDLNFTPSQTGHYATTLSFIDLSRNIIDTAAIDGTGVAPAVFLSQTSVDFGDKIIGSASAPHAVVLKNSGTSTLTITDIAADGEFGVTDTCGSTVDPAAECELDITFFPITVGDKSGAVTVTDDASDSPQTIVLSGTGVAPGSADVSLSTTKLSFPAQLVGTTSAAKSVTLTSDGTVNLVITTIAASGDFAQTHTCAGPLAPGSSCMSSVTFTPTAAGTRTGAVTITDNATDSPQTVALEGLGITVDAPSMSISTNTIDFGDVDVAESSTYTLTLTNSGPSELTNIVNSLAGIGSGGYSKVDHCQGVDIPVGGSCQIDIVFTPNGDGIFDVTLTISSNAVNSPLTVAITGTGVTPGSGGCSLIPR